MLSQPLHNLRVELSAKICAINPQCDCHQSFESLIIIKLVAQVICNCLASDSIVLSLGAYSNELLTCSEEINQAPN